jgi:hypothetical protein
MAWLTRAFGFQEYYRYGDGPSGGQMWVGKATIQVRQAGDGQRSPARLGYRTQSLTFLWTMWTALHAHESRRGEECGRSRMRRSVGNTNTGLRISMDTTSCFRGTPKTAARRSGGQWRSGSRLPERCNGGLRAVKRPDLTTRETSVEGPILFVGEPHRAKESLLL